MPSRAIVDNMPAASGPDFVSSELEAASLPTPFWLMLGEAVAKCQLLAGIPLSPTVADELALDYLARGVRATTAIEGNTLSEAEVKAIVENGTANVSESREYLQREVQNIAGCL